MPSGKKRKRHKMATHKRKKRLRKNRHKKKKYAFCNACVKIQNLKCICALGLLYLIVLINIK